MAPIRMSTEMNGFMFLALLLSSMIFGLTITLDAVGVTLPEFCTMIKFIGGLLYMVPSLVIFLLIFAERIEDS